MPLINAGFSKENGFGDGDLLLRNGPLIQVIVGPLKVPKEPEDFKTKVVLALIDTGASCSVIDKSVAQELGLIVVDKESVSTPSGSSVHNVYLAAIIAPQLDWSIFESLIAGNLSSGGQKSEVLLGRDFLSNTIMIYDGLRAQVTVTSMKITK